MVGKSDFFNEPANLTGWQLLGKVAIGTLVGWTIAALLFVILSFMWGIFANAFGQQTGTAVTPFLSLILLFIGFIATFIGNIAIGGAYNLFYNKKYYNTNKMFGLLFLTNGILFFFFAPIYIVFAKQIDTLFLILGFHVMFSVLISATQIEFSTNPNYSASALMGNVLWFAGTFFVYAVLYKSFGTAGIQQKIYFFMLLPPVLSYIIIPLGAGIREKIYYKFYEIWNNGLYIPSCTDIDENNTWESVSSHDEDDINVEG